MTGDEELIASLRHMSQLRSLQGWGAQAQQRMGEAAEALVAADSRLDALAKLLEGAREWRDSLDGDGWSEHEIKTQARPGMGKMFDAVYALDVSSAALSTGAGEEKR